MRMDGSRPVAYAVTLARRIIMGHFDAQDAFIYSKSYDWLSEHKHDDLIFMSYAIS